MTAQLLRWIATSLGAFAFVFIAQLTAATAGTVSAITILNLPTYDLELDPTRNLIYASVPSRAGVGLGNTITRIDLATKSILDSTFIGSEPEVLALSSDGSQLYVDLAGSFRLRQFNPATLTAGPQVSVAENYMIGDLAVVPGQPGTFVGSVLRAGSPKYVGIGVWHFDGTNFSASDVTGIAAINFAFSYNPSIFYATSGQTLAEVTLGAGDSMSARYGPPLGSDDPAIALGGNLVVSSQGRATDTTTFTAAGTFGGVGGGVAVDPAYNRVFLIQGQTIRIFDMTTFVQIDSLVIPQVGSAGSYNLVRYGTRGLAFKTDQDKVFLIESASIPEPGTYVLALLGLTGLVVAAGARSRKRLLGQQAN